MQDNKMVAKGLEWILDHKEILYDRNKNFDDNELRLLDRTSLLMDRVLLIQKSNEWAAIPLMVEVLYSQLAARWEYTTDDVWKGLVDKIVKGLSECKEAIESEDKEALYESMITTLSYSGSALVEVMFTGKRKVTPEEWETEETIDERTVRLERDLNEVKEKLARVEKINKFLFSSIK